MSSAENLPPRTLARIAREVRELHSKPPDGVKLVVNEQGSLGEIMAEISGPEGTPFHNYFFQLKLVLPSDFPASPPRGFFLTKIYHPNVEWVNGAICVNTLKRDWNSTEITMSHILSVIRCLLIVPFPESSLNDEAGKLFMDSYDEFARRAKLMASVHARTVSVCESVDNESSTSSSPQGANAGASDNHESAGKSSVEKASVTKKKKANDSMKIKKKKSLKRL
uniref:E2 ubiquitin-conjugating enzyme n=1 Tax=Leptocylindrus danicus TaxID=163516 RepID=A0A6U2LYK5_9STRA|mmetsp:Transcript_15844/g.23378  ORF Transcript_15844/g.23378 Transcript_15844/m.23378 type:complete len:223 (+) Transcript_15844:101-769(+)|eukprot:CAMPEP_0116020852 /NCGR_PEP_ID=MMETSP0321-20121206/10042_1 /TAXON_ID=163516 /ORGANISM="Leptocylindrus danicus var. danicus, Strain B650" /LENGTH=222 /DNA_ID=CAMNT_0003491619 /DNA_START=131 /DNA_END=799 /DNA_ORIENTATION=+